MREALKLILPEKKEHAEIKKIAKQVKDKIKIPHTKITFGGSSAKNTFLKHNYEIDMYIKFAPKYYRELDISQILKENLKFKEIETIHGSRDYYHIQVDKYTVELIPILDIKTPEKAQNITDISPFHVKWVTKHKQYANDIRLAKAFCKANKLYGAESFIQGFSGYALEILTIHYKGFNNLMKAVSQWQTKTVLDPEKHYKKQNPLLLMNKSKTFSPIVIVDPVQDTRNVTAVVSKEKYNLFKKLAKQYTKKPSLKFFTKEEFNLEKIKKKYENKTLLTLNINPLEGKRDVVGAKLLKVHRYFLKKLNEHEFEVKDHGWHWDNQALLYYAIEPKKLSKEIKHIGPPVDSKERVEHFKQKWKKHKVKTEKGSCYVMLPRPYPEPEHLVKVLKKDQYVISKVKKIN